MAKDELVEQLTAYLARDPDNGQSLLNSRERMQAVAADVAADDAALRNALLATVGQPAFNRVLLADRRPTPEARADLTKRLGNQGIRAEDAERCVDLLTAAFLGAHVGADPEEQRLTVPAKDASADTKPTDPSTSKSKPIWVKPKPIGFGIVAAVILIALFVLLPRWIGDEEPPPDDETTSTPTVPTPEPTQELDSDQQALIDRLPVNLIDIATCEPGDADQYTKAFIACDPGPKVASPEPPATAPTEVVALQERSAALLQQDLERQFGANLTEFDCGKPPARGNWNFPETPDRIEGVYYCGIFGDPSLAVFAWTYADSQIVVMARSTTADAETVVSLNAWWKTLRAADALVLRPE